MRVEFHGLETVVPDGWHDESTIIFTLPMGGSRDAKERQANISITWDAHEQRDPHVVLDLKMKKLAKTLRSYQLIETGQLEVESRAIPFVVYGFRATRAITQILFAKQTDVELILICGTATSEHFAEVRPHFEKSARALARAKPTA
ncbi:MAG: hypothetical protein A2289_13235 [Deltaproteobacteria bacterium RIFOXYA12_FULL_58_15]|nr:MAG: hypothetical protein A2289_13235 [Deltaproteobacteria bacterium RIFOXYA12_FULL_58_15]OGR13817.1 MAG: hypothetical protein A2341_01340 [Deltaproteobacteria bacterium RIFOXYB12_FULL_58_9]